ncbi:MAG: TROVE domain-containing protein [Cyanothece sp. SIO2G6]|nr:TROVE domain-containing protein [Cyanothece sp. SIO2G6]
MTYNFFVKPRATPQTQPIPGRESEMIKGRSGGYMFDDGIWTVLRRSLLLGTSKNSFYADKHELTDEFVTAVSDCVAADPQRVAQEIVYASDGRAIKNSAPLLALVLLSMGELPAAKQAFLDIFPQVVRTASHFYEWLSYSKALRGFGKVVQQAGTAWLSNPDAKALAYQLLKYQQRHGFTHRDALRLFHVKPVSAEHQALFQWVIQGWQAVPEQTPSEAMSQIWWYERVKRQPVLTCAAIAHGRLTHEMVAPVGKMDQAAWDLLFQDMPMGALLRNLGSLTQLGVIRADKPKVLKRVANVLTNKRRLQQGRIHPIAVLKALKTYQSGGKLGRGSKTWTPVPRVLDILDRALELSFETAQPTNQVFLHAVDVSGSMSWATVGSIGLTCCEVAVTMALATAKAEPNYAIRGFATQFKDLDITARDSFASAMKKARKQNFGGTDASVAYDWAIRNHFHVDVFCFWTDSESWAGRQHPSEALAQYRRLVNPNAKAVYVTLVPSRISLVDPNDSMSWDIHGFDPSAPRAIQMIATGEV